MLNVNVTNTLPIEKMKNLTSIEMFSVEITIEKNRKKKNVNSKQMCVSSQKHRMKKEEGAAVNSSAILFPTFSQRAAQLSFVGQNGQSTEMSPNMGNTHKIPEKTNCRRDCDFQSSD